MELSQSYKVNKNPPKLFSYVVMRLNAKVINSWIKKNWNILLLLAQSNQAFNWAHVSCLTLPQMAWLGFFPQTLIPQPGIVLTLAQLHLFEEPKLRMLYWLSYLGHCRTATMRSKICEALMQYFVFNFKQCPQHFLPELWKWSVQMRTTQILWHQLTLVWFLQFGKRGEGCFLDLKSLILLIYPQAAQQGTHILRGKTVMLHLLAGPV